MGLVHSIEIMYQDDPYILNSLCIDSQLFQSLKQG